jgi:succinylglutamic semialdehyde dehydrogenase
MTISMVGEELVSIEPATGAVFWRGAVSDVDNEVSIARHAWAEWGSKPLTVRVEAARRFVNAVRGKSEALTDCIARETGKPLWEARTEVESVANKVEVSITAFAERTAQRRVDGAMGAKSAVRHKPHGIMAVLGPYNFPAHLPNGHIIPALIAGNAVVFKPSEKTPATGKMLVDLYHAAGIPTGVVRCVIGGPETGKALTSHRDVDGVLFTGSARTGIMLNRQFADQPNKMLALEMGGNNPIVVWDANDIHMAAVIVVQSAFLSAGQRCTAASRLIVQDRIADQLIQEVVALASRLIIGEPHSMPAPYMGPVIDNETADGLQESFMTLMMKGGQPLMHLDRPMANRPFLSPAIIDMTNASERPDHELFGPILQVVRAGDFDEAIAEANNTRYGLSAALVGGNAQLYDRFWANIRAGVINWNKPTNGAPSTAPFGGIGLSGNHRPSAFYAADYCAYPVVSSEEEHMRASIGIGLKDHVASFAK